MGKINIDGCLSATADASALPRMMRRHKTELINRAKIANCNDADCDEMLMKTTTKPTTKIPDDEEDADITGATDNKGGGR